MELPKGEKSFEQERAEQLEDLRTFAGLYDLNIIREEIFEGVPTIVIKAKSGEEVHVGYPDGRSNAHIAYGPAATSRIKGVYMTVFGHGNWHYVVKI